MAAAEEPGVYEFEPEMVFNEQTLYEFRKRLKQTPVRILGGSITHPLKLTKTLIQVN